MERRKVLQQLTTSILGLALRNYAIAARTHKTCGQEIDGKITVINSGIGGNNTVDLLARINQDCLAHHPELTVLMVGTNDMNSQKYVPLVNYRQNLVSIINKIKVTGSQVLLMTILPPYEPYLLTRHPAAFYQPEGVAVRRRQLNDAIRQIATETKVHLLDMGLRFEAIGNIGTGEDSLLQNEVNSNKVDGVHPTPTGYRFMALAIYDYIIGKVLPHNKIICFGDSITKGDGSIDKESYPGYLLKLLTCKD